MIQSVLELNLMDDDGYKEKGGKKAILIITTALSS